MKKLIPIMFALGVFTGLMAQGVISGSIMDQDGNALPGANIAVEGTSLGAATNVNGVYSIMGVPMGTYMVMATYIGYESSSMSVTVGAGTAQADFTLAVSALAGKAVPVIGSRFAHSAEDQAVPVDVFTAQEIRRAGFTETAQVLQSLAPSFNLPRTSIADGSDTVRPMTLRGLSSGQVLVLVNGKRRHTTALVHVNNSPSRGDTGVDLNAIPAAAIEQIEVLRDGAAAQYGSDAIAGVINIVLKSEHSGGSFNVYRGNNEHTIEAIPTDYNLYGITADPEKAKDILNPETTPYTWNPTTQVKYSRDDKGNPEALVTASEDYTVRDGEVTQYQLTRGLMIGDGGSFLIAAEYRSRGASNRVGFEGDQYYEPYSDYWDDDEAESQRLQAGSNWFTDPFRMLWGDQAQTNMGFMFNADLPAGEKRYYAFGGYTARRGDTGCYTRQPDEGNKVWLSSNPTGYVPHIQPEVQDYSMAVGFEGLWGNWAYDISNTYGKNDFRFYMNSTNASYGPEPLREYDIGGFWFDQNSTNVDAITNMGHINFATGLELRSESFRIYAGEEDSYNDGQAGINVVGWDDYTTADDTNGVTYGDTFVLGLNSIIAGDGCQCFSGFKPSNALVTQNADRSVMAVYGDAEVDIGMVRVGGAIRLESYDDTQIDGSSDTYSNLGVKGTARAELATGVVVRGAFGTGFRAPALAQSYQAKIATNFQPDPVTGETVAFEVGTFPVSHGFSKALGAKALIPETSINLSLGGSLNMGGLMVTADLYNVAIEDRIVLTGNFNGDADGNLDGDGDGEPDNVFGYAVQSLLDSANENATGGRFFINGVNTTTSGLDLTVAYEMGLGNLGNVDLSLSYNSTETKIDEINLPSELGSSPNTTIISDSEFSDKALETMFDAREQRTMTNSQPKSNMIIGVNWNGYKLPMLGIPIAVDFKMHEYGEYHSRYTDPSPGEDYTSVGYADGRAQVFSAVSVMDIEVSTDLGGFSIATGIKNLGDTMPDKLMIKNRNNDGAFVYPNFAPNGMNGKFVYTKLSFNF